MIGGQTLTKVRGGMTSLIFWQRRYHPYLTTSAPACVPLVGFVLRRVRNDDYFRGLWLPHLVISLGTCTGTIAYHPAGRIDSGSYPPCSGTIPDSSASGIAYISGHATNSVIVCTANRFTSRIWFPGYVTVAFIAYGSARSIADDTDSHDTFPIASEKEYGTKDMPR